ncbi:unnamed protein product, partial [Meganyctiphanes norvegica]
FIYLPVWNDGLGPGARGLLESKMVSATSASCLSFAYYLAGPHEINVEIQTGKWEEVWHKAWGSGEEWLEAHVTISSDELFSILILGVRGDNYGGVIAVDDIVLREGPCTEPREMCDFERGICDWTLDTSDWPQFMRTKATELGGDHTIGTPDGHILKARNVWADSSREAIANTSVMYAMDPSCVSFWYFGAYKVNAVISVQYVEIDVDGDSDAIKPITKWSEHVPPDAYYWLEGRFSIKSSYYQLIFK